MLNKEQFILLSENLEQAIVHVEVRPVAIATCYVPFPCSTSKIKETPGDKEEKIPSQSHIYYNSVAVAHQLEITGDY